jgi:hypothetical protein
MQEHQQLWLHKLCIYLQISEQQSQHKSRENLDGDAAQDVFSFDLNSQVTPQVLIAGRISCRILFKFK